MKSLAEEVKKFSWYQTIDFGNGVQSSGYAWCGDPVWPLIKHYLPESLENKRVLDLGSNAGIFCIRAAQIGASCLGIESNSWKPEDDYVAQARFVREHFEKASGELDIEYINLPMEEALSGNLGSFDWCFAIASLYYSNEPSYVIRRLYETCDNVIARIRDKEKVDFFIELFKNTGFKLMKLQKEDWSHLNCPVDEFYLFHYAR